MAKVTINLSQGLIEVEGSEEFIESQVQKFQNSMLPAVQEISSRAVAMAKVEKLPQNIVDVPDSSIEALNEQISLRDIAAQNLIGKDEARWVLLYGYVIQKSGKDSFTKDDIAKKYEESGRKTKSRLNKLNRTLKLASNKRWISLLGENNFIIKQDGFTEVEKILNSKSDHISSPVELKKSVSEKKEKNTKKVSESYKPVQDLNFHPEGKESFEEFFLKKMPDKKGSQMEICLVFAYYLEKILSISNISPAHIYTCYVQAGVIAPTALKQVLINTADRKGWINVTDINNITVPINGENEVNYKLPRKGVIKQ